VTPNHNPTPCRTVPTWGICVQVKAPLAMIETFLAWHLELGSSWIAVYFDDPDDPAADALARIPGVKAYRCTDAHWGKLKGHRPELKTLRQVANAQHAYRRQKTDWLAHIDIDEFLLPQRRIGNEAPWRQLIAGLLADVAPEIPVQRLRPYEALADPQGAAPSHFRAPPRFGPARADIVRRVYGDHAQVLDNGMLSHSVGKCFSRTGIKGFQPRLHSPRLMGERLLPQDFCKDIALLHYHATDLDGWLRHVDYRTRFGAYSGREETRNFFLKASRDDLIAFYAAVQVANPGLVRGLEAAHLLLTCSPRLQEARDRVFGGSRVQSPGAATS